MQKNLSRRLNLKIWDEFEAWGNLKMIICDTTAVNTGQLNEVVVKIQNEMPRWGLHAAQYIGCHHHILDRILRHVLDYYNPTTSTKPSLNNEFVDDVINNYSNLLENYKPDTAMEIVENPGFRDDFKYVFVLCAAFRFHKTR